MNIGMDAKRAFHNTTGLGNYSRTLIKGLAEFYPEHHYFLFNPKRSVLFPASYSKNVHQILPTRFIDQTFPSAWRSNWVKKEVKNLGIHLYHGLSHEIPIGIQHTGIPSVVTIHDLIFERYPEQFSKIDVKIYRKKFTYACQFSNRIIAISRQTKDDIINLYGIEETKIDICYQSCHPAFSAEAGKEDKERIRKKYGLPQQFFLYVGSIIERKNLLTICKAFKTVWAKYKIPLVVIGEGKSYKQKVKEYIRQNNLENGVLFLSEQREAGQDPLFQSPSTFAAIYQMAIAMIYPSHFEGFGIPVLEALWSRLPVITSNVSCLPETAGEGAYYVNPDQADEIADGMSKLYQDESLRNDLIAKGWAHAQHFTLQQCTKSVMEVYQKIA